MKKYLGLLGALLLSACLGACGGGSSVGDGAVVTSANSNSSNSSSSGSTGAGSSSTSTASSSSAGSATGSTSSAGGTSAVTIHMIGDSTMTTYTDDRRPQYGWGEKFGQFFNSRVTIRNWAAGGRSSRSFYYETGMWDSAKAAIQPGDYVIIEFGHNDEKYGDTTSTGPYSTYGTYAICSDPSITDGESCTGSTDVVDTNTTLEEHSYYQFLKRYVTEVRAKGGIPILMTPVVRRYLSSGTVTAEGQHDLSAVKKGTETSPRGNYPAAMKAVAARYAVPVIDITAGTKAVVEAYGATAAVAPYLYYPDDTHLNGLYASLVARMAASGLKSNGVLADYRVSTPSIVLGTSSLSFASIYANTTSNQFFNIAGYDLSPASGVVTVTAPDGFKLSTDQTTWSSSLSINYSGSAFTKTIYVEFAPTAAQTYSGTLSMALGGSTMGTVALGGTALAPVSGAAASGLWPMMDSLLSGTATGAVSVSPAIVSSALGTTSTTGTIGSTSYTVNRYAATGITTADAARYIEFDIAPPTGSTFTATQISSYLGGSGGSGVYVDIVYSLDGFATSTALATKFNPASTTSTAGYVMTLASYTGLNIPVSSGQTLSVRLYPYYKDVTSANKFLSIANMTVSGSVQ